MMGKTRSPQKTSTRRASPTRAKKTKSPAEVPRALVARQAPASQGKPVSVAARPPLRGWKCVTCGQVFQSQGAFEAHRVGNFEVRGAKGKVTRRARSDPEAWLEQWREVQQMARDLAALYWQAHTAIQATATATIVPDLAFSSQGEEAAATDTEDEAEAAPAGAVVFTPAEPSGSAILGQIIEGDSAASLRTLSYAEDRAVREAALANRQDWHAEDGTPGYKPSNDLAVYFLDKEHPLTLEEAQEQLLRVRESTVLTLRIALGLWNLRRHHAQLARNGAAVVSYEEILEWRGVKKHRRLAHPGTDSDQRRTDGYRAESLADVHEDFQLGRMFYLHGQHTVSKNKRRATFFVDGPYVHIDTILTLWGDPIGVYLSPGAWINDYEDSGNFFLADVDRAVFQLNPQNEQHELRLAWFFTELWRARASEGKYADPLVMSDILRYSVIGIDYKHLTE